MLSFCFCYHGTEIMEQIKKLLWQTIRKKSTSSKILTFNTLEKSMSIALLNMKILFSNQIQVFFSLKNSRKQYFNTQTFIS